MKNIHVVSTEKPSRLFDDGIQLYLGELKDRKGHPVTNYNIYITSYEEIKEGDWYWLEKISKRGSESGAYKSSGTKVSKLNTLASNCKKIILTTDVDLIKDGVQAIDDEFLEWFVKNPSCEEVEVERDSREVGGHNGGVQIEYGYYEIIIPKEELKCTCKEHDPYCCQVHGICPTCVKKEEPKQVCENCNIEISKYGCACGKQEEPKQETIEEAAENYIKELDVQHYISQEDFILGAKWQSERMYSEEEVRDLLQKALTHQDDGETGSLVTAQGKIRTANFFSWFEQNKKK